MWTVAKRGGMYVVEDSSGRLGQAQYASPADARAVARRLNEMLHEQDAQAAERASEQCR